MSSAAPGLQEARFFANSGGLNNTDSPFQVKESQASGGSNYDYARTGGVQKRMGHKKLNASANADLISACLAVKTLPSGGQQAYRISAGKIQALNATTGVASDLTSDKTGASSSAVPVSTELPPATAVFNTAEGSSLLYVANAQSWIVGAESAAKFSRNGIQLPTGTFTATPSATGGSFTAVGTYRYSIVLRKALTATQSNAYLSVPATISATTDKVTLNFSGLVGIDTAEIDQISIYRSAVGGAEGFTTGVLIAQIASTQTSFVDTGSFLLDAQLVPRAGNVVLDNSPLPLTQGLQTPQGSFIAVRSPASGTFSATGTYRYAVLFYNRTTQQVSNAFGSVEATVTALTDNVTVTLSLTNALTSNADEIWIYRSLVGGADGFTTGSLVGKIASNLTTFVDTGTQLVASQTVPRTEDFGPTQYNAVCTWKRRLVTASKQTLYFSDLNKPESWPLTNVLTLPNGGPIIGLAVISFNTDFGNDEYLAVFQNRKLWLVRGNDYTDVRLSFVDEVGCVNQNSIVLANGYLSWIDYRGIYLWDGSNKPIYCSRPIENFFSQGGSLNKALLTKTVGTYFRKTNQIIWYVSDKTAGEQRAALKLDLRLTLPGIETTLNGRVLDGVFTQDTTTFPIYGAVSFLPASDKDETLLLGDASGFIYSGYADFSDAGVGIDFSYTTPYLSMGSPNTAKRYHKVIVWVEEIGQWNLTLDYWTGYRSSLEYKSTLDLPVTTADRSANAIWDVAQWDVASWDDYTLKLVPLTFNLRPTDQNSNEGDCLRLRFRQDGVDQPITIHGYSVLFSEKGLNK